ncbi:GNAT family N-acetyltransferase [Staphylococcus kloosii]|jgi:GNAT superfamily N-acetyltransferase|uniref:GNAT family N-acetyltransferase n=1 Tax=Staphylococcus kloosii TaxID=29384 RepID=UPI0018A0AD01|nr:GNAT family N-acetyltransferase [Staphylococcus kloosii]MBF7025529.1 GNAT family N-acetyltransferase [Staphylococcus kloosii]
MLKILKATKDDDLIIAQLTSNLLSELKNTEVSSSELLSICSNLNHHEDRWHALIAYYDEKPIGIISIYEVAAIYAKGRLGIIQEFYVDPSYRSYGIGKSLINEATTFAQQNHFKHLEVGTPNIEKWPRTLQFYKNQNFQTIGDRMKLYL